MCKSLISLHLAILFVCLFVCFFFFYRGRRFAAMQLNVKFRRKEEMLPQNDCSLQVINKQSRRPSYTVEPRYNEGPGDW